MASRGGIEKLCVATTSTTYPRIQIGEGSIAGGRGIEKLGKAANDSTARICERAILSRRRV